MPDDGDPRSYEDRRQVQAEVGDELSRALLDAFGIRLTGSPARLAGGEESANWRVASDAGDVVVRISPQWRRPAEVEWINDLIVFASRELPEAVCPRRTRDGGTLIQRNGHCVSVFPFAIGRSLDDEVDEQRLAAPRLLARVHRAIAQWPRRDERPSSSANAPCSWRPAHEPGDLADDALDEWYEGLHHAGEPRGLIHGDFYTRNMLWDGGRITALLDWDEAHVDYMGQEVAWAMWEFSQTDSSDDLDPEDASDFIGAYQAAGGVLPRSFASNATSFIRMRLRSEMRMALASKERGLPFDEEYYEDELRAFMSLSSKSAIPDGS